MPDSSGSLKKLESLIRGLPIDSTQKIALGGVLGETRMQLLNHAKIVLAGPTGENNELTWRAPKHVMMVGGTLAQALDAFVRIAAIGAQVLVSRDHPLCEIAHLAGDMLQVIDSPMNIRELTHIVALDMPEIAEKTQWAARDGALIRVIDARDGVDILPLYEEISCSVNTTAAGGNASLMATAEQ